MTTSRLFATLATSAAAVLVVNAAGAQGYPWRNHDLNFPFLFGNHFDTHQQTRLMPSGDLSGFLYVRHTGDVTTDGLPVAKHADCNAAGDCRVGWLLRGRAGSATFLYHAMHDHPTWQVERGGIPQPGGYSHFHFLGEHPTQTGEVRDGYFLELQANGRFCFVHHEAGPTAGGCAEIGGVPVSAGLDIATHVNIVGSAPVPH